MNPHGDCIYCGGEIVERAERIDYRVKENLYILEDVPTGVCRQCGEQFFKAKVAKKMERAVNALADDVPTVSVPVVAMG